MFYIFVTCSLGSRLAFFSRQKTNAQLTYDFFLPYMAGQTLEQLREASNREFPPTIWERKSHIIPHLSWDEPDGCTGRKFKKGVKVSTQFCWGGTNDITRTLPHQKYPKIRKGNGDSCAPKWEDFRNLGVGPNETR